MSMEYLQLNGKPVKPGKVVTNVEKLDKKIIIAKKEGLKEQLTVIKEVRGELAKAYSEIKETRATNEKLNKEIVGLTGQLKDMEQLQTELNGFKSEKVEAEKLAYTGRLSKLSESFNYLGQVKTVEELSRLDKSTVEELEKVTDLAISTKASEKLDSVTMPSQTVQAQPEVKDVKKEETLNKRSFAEGICDVLTGQQALEKKKIINL